MYNSLQPLLIVPDVHTCFEEAEKAIARFDIQHVLFLGDYWDLYEDGTKKAAETARWLRESVLNPDRQHLLGNHDLPYLAGINERTQCAGSNTEKVAAASRYVNRSLFTRFYVYRWLRANVIASHAGFSQHFLHPYGHHHEHLANQARQFHECAIGGLRHPWLEQGARVGNYGNQAGPLWIDWDELAASSSGENAPHQVVGHSPRPEVLTAELKATKLVNLDASVRGANSYAYPGCVGVFEDSTLSVFCTDGQRLRTISLS